MSIQGLTSTLDVKQPKVRESNAKYIYTLESFYFSIGGRLNSYTLSVADLGTRWNTNSTMVSIVAVSVTVGE